ncbi:hypothetical protein ZHAS_00010980 [Anopheles sinensis]|uniref:Uncharacterized protein n=1 Tax=Anopheles sinensis TaxID=74873 RepID=A0A084VZ08_ANOSI|nr:hypothetical protein ZHAS_00010980 [Anopheles sinensis]
MNGTVRNGKRNGKIFEQFFLLLLPSCFLRWKESQYSAVDAGNSIKAYATLMACRRRSKGPDGGPREGAGA